MQYVIFSDIHGNVDALNKLLEIEKDNTNNRYIFCGDICGYYYYADECVRLLQNIDGLVSVRGNHDQYYLDAYDDIYKTKKLVTKYSSSYLKKSELVRAYIETMSINAEIDIGSWRIYVQHGTPSKPLEGRVYPDSLLPALRDNSIYVSGHTHYRMLRKEDRCIWINPGSLGQPRDGKGFSYCILDSDTNEVTFRNVDVDINNLISEIRIRDPKNRYLEEILYRKS